MFQEYVIMLKKRKIWLFALALSLPLGGTVAWNLHQCGLECDHSEIASIKWRTWLVGSSGSSQYHFIDFLELLYRATHDDKQEKQNAFMDQQ